MRLMNHLQSTIVLNQLHVWPLISLNHMLYILDNSMAYIQYLYVFLPLFVVELLISLISEKENQCIQLREKLFRDLQLEKKVNCLKTTLAQ